MWESLSSRDSKDLCLGRGSVDPEDLLDLFFAGPLFLRMPVKLKNMRVINFLLLMLLAMTATSCEVVGDIFGAGVYTGIFIVIFVVVLIVVVISRIFRR